MTTAELLALKAKNAAEAKAIAEAEAELSKVARKESNKARVDRVKASWIQGEDFFEVVDSWDSITFSEPTVVYAPIGSNPSRPRMISVRKLEKMAELLAVYAETH